MMNLPGRKGSTAAVQKNPPEVAAKLGFEKGKSDNILGIAVLISANAEWRAVKPLFSAPIHTSPYGEYFVANIAEEDVLFFHGGWGKVAAAGSTQYVIDNFHPAHLIRLGSCGGGPGRAT